MNSQKKSYKIYYLIGLVLIISITLFSYSNLKNKTETSELKNSAAVVNVSKPFKKLTVIRKTLNQSILGTVEIESASTTIYGPTYNFSTSGNEYLIKTNSTINLVAYLPSSVDFVGWSGACTGTINDDCEINMSSDKTVTATFKGKSFLRGWSLNLGSKDVKGVGVGRIW
jgi:hypothetical protein